MKRIAILVVFGAASMLAMGTAVAAPPTFDSCESAFNYGANTSRFFVTASLTRAACNDEKMEDAEDALFKSLKKQKIQPHNSEDLKVCFYEGLYSGYIEGLVSEYADCQYHLGIVSVARAAVAVFTAMNTFLDSVDDYEIDQVFDGVRETQPEDRLACETTILDSVEHSGGLVELLRSVCRNDQP